MSEKPDNNDVKRWSFAKDAIDAKINPATFLGKYGRRMMMTTENHELRRIKGWKEEHKHLLAFRQILGRLPPKTWTHDGDAVAEEDLQALRDLRREIASEIKPHCAIDRDKLKPADHDLCLAYRAVNKTLVIIYQNTKKPFRFHIALQALNFLGVARNGVIEKHLALTAALESAVNGDGGAAAEVHAAAANLRVAAVRLRDATSMAAQQIRALPQDERIDANTLDTIKSYVRWQRDYTRWMLTDAGIVPYEISADEKKPKSVRSWVRRFLRRGKRKREWHTLEEDNMDWVGRYDRQ